MGALQRRWTVIRPEVWSRIVVMAEALDESLSHLHSDDPESVRFGALMDASRLAGFIQGVQIGVALDALGSIAEEVDG